MENERPARQNAPEHRQRTRRSASEPTRQSARQQTRSSAPARSPEKKRKKTRVRRLNRTALLIKLLTMLGVVAAIVLSLLIFFKVNAIHVIDSKQPVETGPELVGPETEQAEDAQQTQPGRSPDGSHLYYTAEEIIDASGIQMGDNLLLLNKAEVAAQIKQSLPYVSQVQIKRSLPSSVVITVTEYEISYAIRDEQGGWWLISRDGRVLEQTTEQIATHDHIYVDGVSIAVPQPGQSFSPVGAEGADPAELPAKRNAVLQLLNELENSPEIAKHIVSIDVSSSYNVEMWYGTQFRVMLGKPEEELTYKFSSLLSILDTFARDNRTYLSGSIDLTFFEGRSARFLPSD